MLICAAALCFTACKKDGGFYDDQPVNGSQSILLKKSSRPDQSIVSSNSLDTLAVWDFMFNATLKNMKFIASGYGSTTNIRVIIKNDTTFVADVSGSQPFSLGSNVGYTIVLLGTCKGTITPTMKLEYSINDVSKSTGDVAGQTTTCTVRQLVIGLATSNPKGENVLRQSEIPVLDVTITLRGKSIVNQNYDLQTASIASAYKVYANGVEIQTVSASFPITTVYFGAHPKDSTRVYHIVEVLQPFSPEDDGKNAKTTIMKMSYTFSDGVAVTKDTTIGGNDIFVLSAFPEISFPVMDPLITNNQFRPVYKITVTARGGAIAFKQQGIGVYIMDDLGNNGLSVDSLRFIVKRNNVSSDSSAWVRFSNALGNQINSLHESDTYLYWTHTNGAFIILKDESVTFEVWGIPRGFINQTESDVIRFTTLGDIDHARPSSGVFYNGPLSDRRNYIGASSIVSTLSNFIWSSYYANMSLITNISSPSFHGSQLFGSPTAFISTTDGPILHL